MKKALLVFSLGLSVSAVQAQIADHVVISEIYGGGGNTGAVYTNDFIELYNPTSLPVSVNGWSVQYAAAAGTSWAKTDLTGTIPAKGFYLIQQAQGAGGTTALPTPDATGTLALSGTAGKVALVNNNTALTGACPTGSQIVDFVGFGTTANCNEGAANAPAPSNTTSIERKASATSTPATLAAGGSEALAGNGYDSNVNGSDFVVKALADILPQNSSVIEGIATNTVTAAVGLVPAEPASNGTFVLTLSSPAPSGGVTITYTLSGTAIAGVDYTDVNAGTLTIPELSTSGTINIAVIDDLLAEGNETILLSLQAATAGYAVSAPAVTTAITDDEVTVTKIGVVQGTGMTATAGAFTVEAIVTGVYPNLSPAGFYIQEEDADIDANPLTSEGIFVVSTQAVTVGDKVRVTGPVQESGASPSFNQAVFSSAVVTVLSNTNPLPTAIDITLPVADINDFERYEGMLVRFPASLTVTNNYTLGRFGEVGLSAGGIVYQPSQVIDVNDAVASGTTATGNSNLAALNSLNNANKLRSILLDDGTNTTVTLPYADPVDHTLRLGSTISNLTGILGYAFSVYRIQPIPTAPPVFTYATRPALPDIGNAEVKVASFNVLNYFNGNGTGGGFPTERGAHSLVEFNRQRDKIISAIAQINADVVGLLEIENDGTGSNSAIQDLVNGLNNVMGAGTYSFINDGAATQTYGTDAIRCGILYKPAAVTPNGAAMLSASDSFNRPPLAQKFTATTTNLSFNFVVNHFKSKGCTGATGSDLDQADGQSCFNNRRKLQSVALLNFFNNTVIPTSGTDRIVSVGDYNAYFEEDPLDILRANNYTVLGSSTTYSYQFDGQIGSLDHAVVSNSLNNYISGIAKWNINAAEPVYLDYNDLINDGGSDFENPFAAYYTNTAFRSSDHDPVIIGLNLSTPLPVKLNSFEAVKKNNAVELAWSANTTAAFKEFAVERAGAASEWQQLVTIAANQSGDHYGTTDLAPLKGLNLYRIKCLDQDGSQTYSVIKQVNFAPGNAFTFYPNPAHHVFYLDNAKGRAAGPVMVSVTNMLNQVVSQNKWEAPVFPLAYDIGNLPQGIYYIRVIEAGNQVTVQRLVKK